MEKYAYLVLGFALSIISTGAVGVIAGVPGVCIYFNSCEPDPEIERLRNEILSLNAQINEKNDEIIESTNKIIELQDKAKVSFVGAKDIIDEIQGDIIPTRNTLELVEQYVKKQKEIERHVTKILCVYQPALVADSACSS